MVIRSIEDEAINKRVHDDRSQVTGKIVRNMGVARKLLSRVNWEPSNELRVIDIKKNKDDPTGNSTVIIFENNDTFQRMFAEVIEENRREKNTTNSHETNELKKQIAELNKKIAELSSKED